MEYKDMKVLLSILSGKYGYDTSILLIKIILIWLYDYITCKISSKRNKTRIKSRM